MFRDKWSEVLHFLYIQKTVLISIHTHRFYGTAKHLRAAINLSLTHVCDIIILVLLVGFSHQITLVVFLWNLSDNKSPLVSKTLLSINISWFLLPLVLFSRSFEDGSKRFNKWYHRQRHVSQFIKFSGRYPGCNGYRRRKWKQRHEFKSWTRLIAFHISLIPLGKVWIQLFSLQLDK